MPMPADLLSRVRYMAESGALNGLRFGDRENAENNNDFGSNETQEQSDSSDSETGKSKMPTTKTAGAQQTQLKMDCMMR